MRAESAVTDGTFDSVKLIHSYSGEVHRIILFTASRQALGTDSLQFFIASNLPRFL
jgi:hypothetical protein